jgi:hypothetical protein
MVCNAKIVQDSQLKPASALKGITLPRVRDAQQVL